jgi:hypothetical protein
MATLHVRNVPDPLYESLRECASANERSIGAEVIVLIERRVLEDMAQKPRVARRGPTRRRPSTPFQHFEPAARETIVTARREAIALGAPGIGTEHILLALVQAPNLLSTLLQRSGLDYTAARAAVETASEPPAGPVLESIPFTPEAKEAMELALRHSLNLGAAFIGPEHLLLGVSSVQDGLGAHVLADAGLQWPMLNQELLTISSEPVIERLAQPEPLSGFRVVELEGPAEEWERLLNSHAAKGHELIEIVEKRAIFRVPVL